MIALRYFLAAAGIVGASIVLSVWDGPSDGAPRVAEGLPPGYGTALHVPAAAETESDQVWTHLAAAIELIRSSRESVTQAESLRGTAARLAQISRENVEARKKESDPAGVESAQYQQLIAESQLSLAEDLLAKARQMSEGAVVMFEIARQNAFRSPDGDESREPGDDARADPPDLIKAKRPGAARRNRPA